MYSSYKILNLSLRPIGNPDQYKFPAIGKPILCGGFRLSPEGFFEFERDSNHLIFKQIMMPPASGLPFPLSVNSRDNLHRIVKSISGKICNMLFFIDHSKQYWLKVNATSDRAEVNADVICSRDILQLFMCAPYESQNNWTVAVTRYRNTIYISQVKNTKADSFEKDELILEMQASWMKELEKQCLKGPQDECHGVFVMDICGQKVVFNAPLITETNTSWADLRLRLDTMSRLEWADHKRYELIEWWTNCFLVGIDSIYVGLRDDDAIVHRIQKMTIRELYKGQSFWAPCVCATALSKILQAIKNVTTERNLDCPNTVILFEFDANQGQIIHRTLEKRSSYTFVGEWYRKMLNEFMDEKQLFVQKSKN
ncbi:protein cutoff [Drosophila willistoni]|uniref:protein cutoff n=1 Tax=Drosophila willistoni TaxID=7260 RepID=UPI001F07C40E|nr:protein cutoff [Drosophila willistoni]